jgi:hypothetical protein
MCQNALPLIIHLFENVPLPLGTGSGKTPIRVIFDNEFKGLRVFRKKYQ